MENPKLQEGAERLKESLTKRTLSASWIGRLSVAQVSLFLKLICNAGTSLVSTVRTPCFHCSGEGFDPSSGNQDPAQQVMRPKKKKKSAMQFTSNFPKREICGNLTVLFDEIISIFALMKKL